MSVLRIDVPEIPWMRFEWHPGEHKVYVIRQNRDNPIIANGRVFAEKVTTELEARRCIQSFLAGYRHHLNEPKVYDGAGPRHRKIFLDPGTVGWRAA